MTTADQALAYYRDRATYEECKALTEVLRRVAYGWELMHAALKTNQDPEEGNMTIEAVRRRGDLTPCACVMHHSAAERVAYGPDGPETVWEDEHYEWTVYYSNDEDEGTGRAESAQEALDAADETLRAFGYTIREETPVEPIEQLDRLVLLMGSRE